LRVVAAKQKVIGGAGEQNITAIRADDWRQESPQPPAGVFIAGSMVEKREMFAIHWLATKSYQQ